MLPGARPGVACSCQHEGMTVSSAPLIGRDADVARLDDALERARSGSPVFALLRGEAGMGKSRLVDAFADRLGDDAIVARGQCVDLGDVSAPHAPITSVLRAVVGALGLEFAREAAAPALAALTELTPEGGSDPAPSAEPARPSCTRRSPCCSSRPRASVPSSS